MLSQTRRIPWNKGKKGLQISWNKKPINLDGKKKCRDCSELKEFNDFTFNKSSNDGRSCHCRKCFNIIMNHKKSENPHKYKEADRLSYIRHKNNYRSNQLKRTVGINLQEYNSMFTVQEGKCKICRTHQSKLNLGLAVDHCHKTGRVRGLLCGKCNTALGLLEDNSEIVKGMIEYLKCNQPTMDVAQLGIVSA